jgi:hypothetical protein
VLASLCTILVVHREQPAAAAAGTGIDEVLRELAELQRRLDERLAGPERAVAASDEAEIPTREPVGTQVPELERLASLIERLATVLAQQRAVGGPAPVPRDLPVNHAALTTLHALARQDRDAARRSTMLLTAEELLARFGLPDEVGGSGDNGVFWNYFNLGPDGVRKGGTCFVLKEGRVLWHEISIPD